MNEKILRKFQNIPLSFFVNNFDILRKIRFLKVYSIYTFFPVILVPVENGYFWRCKVNLIFIKKASVSCHFIEFDFFFAISTVSHMLIFSKYLLSYWIIRYQLSTETEMMENAASFTKSSATKSKQIIA